MSKNEAINDDQAESRSLTRDELRDLLASQGDAAAETLAAMFSPETDTTQLLLEATSEGGVGLERAPFPFARAPGIDAAQLAAFNAQFAAELATPVSEDAARSVKFQTKEDWNGYVTTGAARFIMGKAVNRPAWRSLHDPPNDMTFALRPGQDPAQAPLCLSLFGDFGNGLYAAREVARRITARQLPYAFHLGDVYYDGTSAEFASYFEEPLSPLLDGTELFMVAGNHDMYSKGESFQRYIQHKARVTYGFQRQNAELFRLRGHGVQIIGLDTMWCGWEGKPFRGNEPRLDAPTAALLEQWLTEGDPDGLNILLSSNEPFSIGSRDTTKMLEDINRYVRRGLIDLWFWGNVHHAALYDPWRPVGSVEHGFVGGCVGHGGYPFYTAGEPRTPSGVTCRWSERRHRFWPYDGVRPDVGLNGYAELEITRNAQGWETSVVYRDWVGRDRARATVAKTRGMGPRIVKIEENLSPDRGGANWTMLP